MRAWIDDLPWVVRQSWPRNGLSFYPAGRQRRACRLGVGHSTETTTFPGYRSGADAPHVTLDLRTGELRQHIAFDYGARALAISAGGISNRTVNIDGVVQMEVNGAVTPGYPERFGHYDLVKTFPTDERAHYFMARALRAIHDATGIPLQTSSYAVFGIYPDTYGARNRNRLSDWQFADAMGWIAHQHVPANDHGDGTYGRAVKGKAVDFEAVLAMARELDPWGERPDYSATPSPANNFYFPAGETRAFQAVVNELIDAGVLPGPRLAEDGVLHGKTMTAVRGLQQLVNAHIRADYLPGELLEEDGLHGPRTTTATEALMTLLVQKLDQMLAGQRRIETALADNPEETAAAIKRDVSMGFSGDWWNRRGLVTDPEHRAFPADPGSPADKELRAEAKANGGRALVYTPGGTVTVRLDPSTDRFVKEA